MVVTCEKCHTRFLLDEARITGGRAQVRCSRCQQVFWVEQEENLSEMPHPEEEEAGARILAGRGRPEPAAPFGERKSTLTLEEGEGTPEAGIAAAKAALPKPSILFTAPAKRSPWPLIIALILGLAGGTLAGGAIMWFGGYGWLASTFKTKPPAVAPQALAPPAKVEEPPKVVTMPPPPAPAPAPADLKDLEITGQEERYRGMVNTKGGQLLVIQGKVKNASKQLRGPIKIHAVLTDPQQKTVKERDFYAGTVIFDDELKSLDPQEINRWLDTPGGRAQKQTLEPGESQSFMVVFFGTPASLSGYGYKIQVVQGPVASSHSRGK